MLQTLLEHLIYLPSIGIPLGFSSRYADFETFPWALLFALNKKTVIQHFYLLVMVFFGVGALYSAASSGDFVPALRSFFAILNASLIFWRILGADKDEYYRLAAAAITVFFINAGVSIIQILNLFPEALANFMRYFIPRFTENSLGAGRGVAGLFAEPAYAGYAMHYLFALLLFFFRISPWSSKGLILVTSMLVYDITVSKSFTDLAMLSILLSVFVQRKYLLRAAGLSVILTGMAIYLSQFMEEMPRSLALLNNIFFTWDTSDIWTTLINESGHRLVSIISSYAYGFTHPFGGGLGSWPTASVAAMEAFGIPSFELYYFLEANDGFYFGIRPTAFAAGLFLELGVIGFTLYILCFKKYFINKEILQDKHARAVLALFLFNFFILGTIGDPFPYIAVSLVYIGIHKYPRPASTFFT